MKNKKLYDKLGVSPNASQEEIKKAFRSKAKTNHPDHHNGDAEKEEEFKEMSAAYNVLSNLESRKKYDETGEENPKKYNPVIEMLAFLFQEVRRHAGFSVLYIDIIKQMKEGAEVIEQQARKNAKELRQQNMKINKLAKLLKHKTDGPSVLHMILTSEKRNNKIAMCGLRKDMLTVRKVQIILEDYSFKPEKQDMSTPPLQRNDDAESMDDIMRELLRKMGAFK
jgi:curved DNA-binding protein CbpA